MKGSYTLPGADGSCQVFEYETDESGRIVSARCYVRPFGRSLLGLHGHGILRLLSDGQGVASRGPEAGLENEAAR